MKDIDRLLASYPRSRPPLTPAHEAIYVGEYSRNRSARSGLARIVAGLESWMHRQVARAVPSERILEIGAGTLNHLKYESSFSKYDVVEPFTQLWQGSPEMQRVNHFYSDINEIPSSERYERVLSIAVLEHLTNLPDVVARSALLLQEGGSFLAGIPSEGALLWEIAWRATTGVSFRLRTGLPYSPLMRHEHVNTADEILSIVSHIFTNVKVRRFPLHPHHLSFYTTFEATDPILERAKARIG